MRQKIEFPNDYCDRFRNLDKRKTVYVVSDLLNIYM